MNTASIQADFLAAKAKTAVTILNGSGWKQSVVNPACMGVDSVFFYVFDYQTQWVWCCSIPKEGFYSVLESARSMTPSETATCCAAMIAERAAANDVNQDRENVLAITLTAYVGITKSYQLTERATKANHFVVIRYGHTDTLRPVVLTGPDRHFIVADRVEEVLKMVISRDGQLHPEWIKG